MFRSFDVDGWRVQGIVDSFVEFEVVDVVDVVTL
jgi:hypothetical protein